MHYHNFAFCDIVMKDKTNSQVWRTSIIPGLIKSTKNINQDRFGNMGSAVKNFLFYFHTSEEHQAFLET